MRFTQDFIDKVRDANNIVEIIGQHTELKGAGQRLMGRCPFPDHSDKSPSFSVSEDHQLYFCYGCKKGGNVFNFLETFNGLSFPEAIEFLARRASIALPEKPEARAVGSSGPNRDLLLKVNKLAAVYYYRLLQAQDEDSPAKKYLLKRGLNAEIVEKFRIGLSGAEWQGLGSQLESKKVPLALAETLGLLKPKKSTVAKQSKTAADFFDLFRERLMFPIFSPTADVIGFGGRTLTDALPKYVNSSDSPVFNKSRVLYGLHETGKFIRAQDEAIVVEGYMDAISLYSTGIKNVVAILGTAFTPEHAKLLKRYTHNVKMLLDGDDAGIGGAERSLPILLAAGLMPKGYVLPDKMDPDDYVKANGADALRAEVARAPELFSLLLRKRWLKDYHGTASDKVRVIEEASTALKAMQDRQLMELYILELAQQLDVDVPWVRRTVQARLASAFGASPGPSAAKSQAANAEAIDSSVEDEAVIEVEPVITLKGAPRDEVFVLSMLLYNESLMRDLVDAGADEVLAILTHQGVVKVLRMAVEDYRAQSGSPDFVFAKIASKLSSRVDLPAALMCSLAMIPPDAPEGSDQKLIADYLQAIRTRHLKQQGKALVTELRDDATPEKLAEFMALQRSRLTPRPR